MRLPLFIIPYSLSILLLLCCQSTVVYSSKVDVPKKQYPVANASSDKANSTSDFRLSTSSDYMTASWYGTQFHGRLTANGETFNMYDLTAAHKTLPFNTRLKLINEENGKEVIVRINDRGPFVGDRDIDVSFKAAEELGFVSEGVCRLRVIFLD